MEMMTRVFPLSGHAVGITSRRDDRTPRLGGRDRIGTHGAPGALLSCRISSADAEKRGDAVFDKAVPSSVSNQMGRDCFHVREPHHEYDYDVSQQVSIQGGIDFGRTL